MDMFQRKKLVQARRSQWGWRGGGGVGGGAPPPPPPQIFAKIDLLPIEKDSKKKKR